MCPKPKIEKADPVAPPPPAILAPHAPVLNEASRISNAEGNNAARARRGRSALTIERTHSPPGVNIPR